MDIYEIMETDIHSAFYTPTDIELHFEEDAVVEYIEIMEVSYYE